MGVQRVFGFWIGILAFLMVAPVATAQESAEELAKQLANPVDTKVLKLGNQLASVVGGVRYWAKSADAGPEGSAGRDPATGRLQSA